jgi:hypothetical protein
MNNEILEGLSLDELNLEIAKAKGWIIETRLCTYSLGYPPQEIQEMFEDSNDKYWSQESMEKGIKSGEYFYLPVQKQTYRRNDDSQYTTWSALPSWSNNIKYAWELVEEMVEHGLIPSIDSCDDKGYNYWRLLIVVGDGEDGRVLETTGDTVQIAICKIYLGWKYNLE